MNRVLKWYWFELIKTWKNSGSYWRKPEKLLDLYWKKKIFIITELVLGLARVYYDCQMFFLVRHSRFKSCRNKKKAKTKFNSFVLNLKKVNTRKIVSVDLYNDRSN